MKEKILALRAEGKSFRDIATELGCSKSTISFHCSPGQKEKNLVRHNKRRAKCNNLNKRVSRFQNKKLYTAARKFMSKGISEEEKFSHLDIIKKFGEETTCYLSGEKINLLTDKHFHLDHINPSSQGGNNTLDNLGILHETVNMMKGGLTVEEMLTWCQKILEHNGYEVTKK